MGMQEE
jgi:hypothetical protein